MPSSLLACLVPFLGTVAPGVTDVFNLTFEPNLTPGVELLACSGKLPQANRRSDLRLRGRGSLLAARRWSPTARRWSLTATVAAISPSQGVSFCG